MPCAAGTMASAATLNLVLATIAIELIAFIAYRLIRHRHVVGLDVYANLLAAAALIGAAGEAPHHCIVAHDRPGDMVGGAENGQRTASGHVDLRAELVVHLWDQVVKKTLL